MSKKWYNFFVVTDGHGSQTSEPVDPPRRAEEVAPEPPPSLAPETVAGTGTIADVYDAARISAPAHGYTVLKVAEMLQSEHLRELPSDVRRKSILVALDAAGVPVDEIVRDAVARDRALDTYERVLASNLEEIRAAKTEENQQLEAEIAQRVSELRARIDENNQQVGREQQALQNWRERKRREESTIAEAVSHFVSENPITVDVRPDATGDADVR